MYWPMTKFKLFCVSQIVGESSNENTEYGAILCQNVHSWISPRSTVTDQSRLRVCFVERKKRQAKKKKRQSKNETRMQV